MRFLKELLLRLGMDRLVPAQELLIPFRQQGAWPDRMAIGLDFAGQTNLDPAVHVRVARDRDARWLLAYAPIRSVLVLDTSALEGDRVQVTIHDPATGEAQRTFERARSDELMLVPDEDLDSLVVVESI